MTDSHTFTVAIIDYRMGNMFSVQHACRHAGLSSFITSDGKEISRADGAILPGVGAFGEAMQNLDRLGLVGIIKDCIWSGKPFMGVCLGMQLLFTESDEFGLSRGLDIVGGRIVKFPSETSGRSKVKVPQIGWNRIQRPRVCSADCWEGTPLQETPDGAYMYFVHSYYAIPASDSVTLSKTSYGGIDYCSSLVADNVFATQFHPEKSAKEGIAIYKKWLELSKGREK
jgi:glutamine amidotransferase